jgi:hypothetical protein
MRSGGHNVSQLSTTFHRNPIYNVTTFYCIINTDNLEVKIKRILWFILTKFKFNRGQESGQKNQIVAIELTDIENDLRKNDLSMLPTTKLSYWLARDPGIFTLH